MSDLIFDFTGWNIPLPIYSYGFMVALAFLAAAYFFSLELKRKEKQGLLHPFPKTTVVGAPVTKWELILNGLLGFLLGYKLIHILMNYPEFAARPQAVLLSAEGSVLGGLLGAGLLAYWKFREKKREQLDAPKTETVMVHPHQAVGDMVIIAAVFGIAGAKLFYLFETPGNFESFLRDPLGSFFGGLTVYGGLILGSVAVLWFAKKKGLNPIHVADASAPSLFLAYTFGRYGCQISGDGDWGIVNTLKKPGWLSWLPDNYWAFDYPHNIIDEGVLMEGCHEAHCFVLAQPVFPTPVYESAATLALFLLLWSVRKHITIPGLMFSIYFILNGIERYLIEQVRVNTKFELLGINITQAEIIAIIFSLIGVVGAIYFLLRHRASRDN